MKRTFTCGEANEKCIGKSAVINGWVNTRRDHGGLVFIDVRDRYGLTQVVFNSEVSKESYEKAQRLGKEFVVAVKGKIAKRPQGTENPKLSTGQIELIAEELNILNESKQPLPLEVSTRLIAGEDTRLTYRYLDLRRPEMQANIVLRHKMIKAIRDYFDSRNFLEIETPILAKSTPEGARDYLVPSRVHKGKFFALPQSPQLFKQILMVSGLDKYFQIAKCFRDEDLRADRQPEFTQLDVEMSFLDEEDIYSLIEGCIKHVFKEIKGIEIKTPFPRMNYPDAMNLFGSDKPDLRFGMELIDISECFKATNFSIFKSVLESKGTIKAVHVSSNADKIGKGEINRLTETAKIYGAKGIVSAKVGKGTIDSMIAKHLSEAEIKALLHKTNAKEGDMIFIIAADWKLCCTVLGQIRLQLAAMLNLVQEGIYKFLWVTEFPMFEWSEEEQKLSAVHHPFTSPMIEDLEILEKEPAKARSRAYDVVLNGTELGGGSIRIHQRAVQDKIFRLLGLSKEDAGKKFGFLLEAFSYGAPPHGGIALGLDRFAMILANAESLREVIAFPKNKACVSQMDDAPSEVSEAQMKELGLKIVKEK